MLAKFLLLSVPLVGLFFAAALLFDTTQVLTSSARRQKIASERLIREIESAKSKLSSNETTTEWHSFVVEIKNIRLDGVPREVQRAFHNYITALGLATNSTQIKRSEFVQSKHDELVQTASEYTKRRR